MLSVGGVRGRLWVCALAALLGVAPLAGGCGEREPKKENVGDVVEAQHRARQARAQANIQAIHTALQQHQAEHGRFPESLEALPFVRDQQIDTSWYAYDPATGQVRMREER